MVYTKLQSDTEKEKHVLLKKGSLSWHPNYIEYPPIIPPMGLTPERQWYLFKYIREEEDCNVTCLEPTVPQRRSRAAIYPSRE